MLNITVTIGVGVLTSEVTNAQLFYPPASDRHSLMVIGQGVVKVPADTADIQLVFTRKGINDESETQPSARRLSSPTLFLNDKIAVESLPNKTLLNKATLQPVVDSLIANGISADKIQVQINTNFSDNNAKILVRLEKPTRDRVQEIIATA